MSQQRESGLTLIEVLVALVILGVGLIGTLGLQGTAKSGSMEAFQRTQAVLIARDLSERMSANRQVSLNDYNGTYDGSTTSVSKSCLGTTACTPAEMASWDLYQFNQALLGNSEVRGAYNTGGIVNAQGCVQHSSGQVSIAIFWKGVSLGKKVALPASPHSLAKCSGLTIESDTRMFVLDTFIGAAL